MLADAHCHLDDRRYDDDRREMIARARAAGVTHLVTVGCDPEGIRRARALADVHADTWCTVGIHPHHAAEVTDDFVDGLAAHFAHPRVVAVGECGLDYYYDHSPRERQREVFARQVALARRVKKPLMIHVRDAYDELMDILLAEKGQEVGGIMHCFTGTWAWGKKALDLGFDLSIPGVLTFQKPGELPTIVREAPLDRLLTETDSPYLAPVPHRGKRNEPAFVAHVADAIAAARGLDPEETRARTAQNAIRRLGLR
ncbi:MAG: TatD family hydrolase [Deltaproteobacteria bacterium]|nr:TatD family hydrolase [Deltaproteobacteria bacterium]